MSEKQDWRERWEENDKFGYEVEEVATWKDGSYAGHRLKSSGTYFDLGALIPRKPAPVVVPWEPDEVPVGAVVRMKKDHELYGVITERHHDTFLIKGVWYTCFELHDIFVIHQPGVPTEQCQPCGKVVRK